MRKIVDVIKDLQGLNYLAPAQRAEIEDAEYELGLTFADDFKEYVQAYGVISAKGIELTGVTASKRLDVVSVTKAERELGGIPTDMYVVENLAIDGILILQNSYGEIFSIMPHQRPQKIHDSLADYILHKVQVTL